MPGELIRVAPARVLAIYAHPDDCDVSCGGALARWSKEGSEVHLVVCAMGDKGSSDPLADIAALIEQREQETHDAAEVLGVASVHLLAHRDGELENDLALRGELVALMRAFRPDALVCPDPSALFFGEHYFNHRDHRVVGFAALDAAFPAAASPLYFPEHGKPTTIGVAYLSGSLEPNVYVDVTATIDRKADAIICHKSQLGETGEWFRTVVHERAEQAGRQVGVPFAEAFRRLQGQG